MSLVCKYLREPWKKDAAALTNALDATAGPEKVRERALVLLQWNGTVTADYLAKDSGVTPWRAAEILSKLKEEGFCEFITLPDP